MFQMDKHLFDQCWPVIAAQIEAGKSAAPLRDDKAPAPSHAAEAGYVLGVAIGFSRQLDVATGALINDVVPGGSDNPSGRTLEASIFVASILGWPARARHTPEPATPALSEW